MNILDDIAKLDKNHTNDRSQSSSVTKVIEHIYKLAFDKKFDELNSLLLLINANSSKIMMVTILRTSSPFKSKLSNWNQVKENCREWLEYRNEKPEKILSGIL